MRMLPRGRVEHGEQEDGERQLERRRSEQRGEPAFGVRGRRPASARIPPAPVRKQARRAAEPAPAQKR
jgi:hypothetical protein